VLFLFAAVSRERSEDGCIDESRNHDWRYVVAEEGEKIDHDSRRFLLDNPREILYLRDNGCIEARAATPSQRPLLIDREYSFRTGDFPELLGSWTSVLSQ